MDQARDLLEPGPRRRHQPDVPAPDAVGEAQPHPVHDGGPAFRSHQEAAARHGPAGIEPLSGDVIGFVVTSNKPGSRPVYISGDTTWFDGVAEVARRFKAGVVLPFAGAAQTRGPFHLTMDTNDTIETARAFADAVIVPVHTDGWAHFRQGANDLRVTFDTLGFGSRLLILEPGVAAVIEPLRAA